MGARLPRAAEPERAVQEGRQPAQRPGPDREHLLPARLRLHRRRRPARPVPLVGPLHAAQARARRRQDRRRSSRRSSTTSTSCSASASTAPCSAPSSCASSAAISTDFARDTADITDRQNIQYHWIRIEDVPAIWQRLEAVGLQTTEACGDSPRGVPRLARRRRRRRRDHRRHLGPRGDQAALHRRPRVLQPAAQVQDRPDRAPEPGRGARGQRRLVRRHRPPGARSRLRPLGRRRPVHQPDARAEARRVDPARRGARRLGRRRLGLPRLRLPPAALARPAEVPGRRLGRREVPRGPRDRVPRPRPGRRPLARGPGAPAATTSACTSRRTASYYVGADPGRRPGLRHDR